MSDPSRTAKVDETALLVFAVVAFVAILAMGFVGRALASDSKGPVGWEVLSPGKANLILRSNITGPQCFTLAGQAVPELRGREVEMMVPGMGRVSVQSHNLAEYTVQPLGPLQDVDGCVWSPPVPFEWLKE